LVLSMVRLEDEARQSGADPALLLVPLGTARAVVVPKAPQPGGWVFVGTYAATPDQLARAAAADGPGATDAGDLYRLAPSCGSRSSTAPSGSAAAGRTSPLCASTRRSPCPWCRACPATSSARCGAAEAPHRLAPPHPLVRSRLAGPD